MRLASVIVAVVVCALLAPAALAQQVDPAKGSRLVRTLHAGARSPVSFSAKIRNFGGTSTKALRKGARLRAGQTVEIAEMTGSLVGSPGECGCQAYGLRARPGTQLANVFLKAVHKGRTIAVAPPHQLIIEGTGPKDLGFTYDWAKGTKRFPKGTKIVMYGLFVRR